jgi:Ca2+-transporting ATPase
MASNSGEILTLFLAPMLGLPMPLLPLQILWINLVTDGLPGLALAMEPEEKNIMARPPRPPGESVFSHGLGFHIVWVGLLMGGACVMVQGWALSKGHGHWQSMVFTALCLAQMGHVLAIRSETESLFTQGLFSNKPLLISVILTVLLQMAVIYIPVLNPIFNTQPLELAELGITLAVPGAVFFAVELEKALRRNRAAGYPAATPNA